MQSTPIQGNTAVLGPDLPRDTGGNRILPKAIGYCIHCNTPMRITKTSAPPHKRACTECRRAKGKPTLQHRAHTCIECGRSWVGRNRDAGVCGTCMQYRREAKALLAGKVCAAPNCTRGAINIGFCGGHAASSRRTMHPKTCQGCGNEYTTREKHSTHCSIQCFNKSKTSGDYLKAAATRAQRVYPYECKVCGHQGIGYLKRTLCDDTMCQYLGNNGRASCPWYYKTCAWCDDPFTTEREAQIYCTTKCSESRKASMNGRKPRPYRRYAQLVYQRDNYVCHLCGKHTLKAWDENNKAQSPTLDHIIPKSQGGPDTPDNLATACFECNVRRGVKDAEAYRRSLLTLV